MANLTMGRQAHSEFRPRWEAIVEDMEAAGMRPDIAPTVLRRKYLEKLSDELRALVLSKEHPLDGAGKPPRAPRTWEEVAEA
eukprot:386999-Alexandrium_andersonii.AAC.1